MDNESELIVIGDAQERPAINPDNLECVYFLHAIRTDLVKVGWSRHLPSRVAKLSTSCPYALNLLAVDLGGRDLESSYHRSLKPYHQRGEWFLLTEEVRRWLMIAIRCDERKENGRAFTVLARRLHELGLRF